MSSKLDSEQKWLTYVSIHIIFGGVSCKHVHKQPFLECRWRPQVNLCMSAKKDSSSFAHMTSRCAIMPPVFRGHYPKQCQALSLLQMNRPGPTLCNAEHFFVYIIISSSFVFVCVCAFSESSHQVVIEMSYSREDWVHSGSHGRSRSFTRMQVR